MTVPLNLDSIAAAHAARMVALLTAGSLVAVCGAMAVRLASRLSAAARCTLALGTLAAMAAVVVRPEAVSGNSAGGSYAVYVSPVWARAIFLVWAALAGFAMIRVAVGLLRVVHLKRAAVEVGPLPSNVRQAVASSARFGRGVRLLGSREIKVPSAVGFFRPAVLLPLWMLEDSAVSADDLHALVLHELAHLARYDDWVNLAQQVAKAVLFFHPAVWWLDARIGLEREMACDDAVLRTSPDAHSYARCLARIAEQSYFRQALALAQAAVGRVHATSLRVKRLLHLPAARSSRRSAAALAGSFAVIAAATLAPAPRVFTLQSSNSASAHAVPMAHAMLAASRKYSTPARVIEAAVPLEAAPAIHPVFKPAKTRHGSQPGVLRTSLRQNRRAAPSYYVVIEAHDQLVAPGVQVETVRVVVLRDVVSTANAILHTEI